MYNNELELIFKKEKETFEERSKQIFELDEVLSKKLTASEAINALYNAINLDICSRSEELWTKVLRDAGLPVIDISLTNKRSSKITLGYSGFKVILPVLSTSGPIDYYIILDKAAATFSPESIQSVRDSAAAHYRDAKAMREEYLEISDEPSMLKLMLKKNYRNYFKSFFSTIRWHHEYVLDSVPRITRKELRPLKTRRPLIEKVVKCIEQRADEIASHENTLTSALNQFQSDFEALWPRIKEVTATLDGTVYGEPTYGVLEENGRGPCFYNFGGIGVGLMFSEVTDSIFVLSELVEFTLQNMEKGKA